MNGPRFLAAVIILLTLLTQFIGAASAHGTLWQPAERITHNDLEDRTTSGSLTNGSFGLTVVWMQEQVTPGWRLMWSELSGLGSLDAAPAREPLRIAFRLRPEDHGVRRERSCLATRVGGICGDDVCHPSRQRLDDRADYHERN